MRGNTGYRYNGVYGNYMPNGNITVNNITNITNITNVVACPLTYGRRKQHHNHKIHDRKRNEAEKPPKLTRFCASGGLLDYDVAASMSDGELFSESLAVAGYGFRGAARHAGNIINSGGDLIRDIGGMGDGLFKVAEGLCRLVGLIL